MYRTVGYYTAKHPIWSLRHSSVGGLRTLGAVDLGPILAGALSPVSAPAAAPGTGPRRITPGMAPSGPAKLAQAQAQIQAVMQGVGALDNFVRSITTKPKTVETRMTKDWDSVRAGLQIAKAIPHPVAQLGAAAAELLVNLAYELFGTKPCDFNKKGDCSATVHADGSRSGGGECCNPFPKSSGRGVIVTDHAAGYKRYPGQFAEIPAGNYYKLDGKGVPRDQMILKPASANQIRRDMYKIAPRMFADKSISSMLVPDGWAVEIFSEPGFKGKTKTFGPGFHRFPEMGWNDQIRSMRVRGPWSIHDRLHSEMFKNKAAGWITERARKPVSSDMILALSGLDSLRPKQPGYQPFDSVWRPGWYLRLSEAGVLNSQSVKMVFDELGFTPEDLEREKLISMEKTLDTVTLLLQTANLGNQAQAAELLQSAFTAEQLEIASLLSRYGLDQATLTKIRQGLEQSLPSLKKKLGVSATAKVWRKPRFDITQVAFAAD